MPRKRIIAPRLPWLSPEGYVIPSKLPLDPILAQAVSEDEQKSRHALNVLRMIHGDGRMEAGIFLLGLFAQAPDDWERRQQLVEALAGFATEGCARVLFSEFQRVKSSNSTRRYLGAVIQVLSRFPSELVQERFEALAEDTSFSYRMREKFRRAAGEMSDLDEFDF